MKALVYHGPGNYSLDDVPVPKITNPKDAIGKVTLAAICTSDVHMVQGHIPTAPMPKIVGHEFCVEIVETGSEVKGLKPGMRCVVFPAVFCGQCKMCKSGLPGLCEKYGIFGVGQHKTGIEFAFLDFLQHFPKTFPFMNSHFYGQVLSENFIHV